MSKLGFAFPGRGSQSVGMLSDLNAAFPSVSQTFVEASDELGLDLWKLVQEGPKAELNLTHVTQPAMLTAGVAIWRLWREQGWCSTRLDGGTQPGRVHCSGLCCGTEFSRRSEPGGGTRPVDAEGCTPWRRYLVWTTMTCGQYAPKPQVTR